MDDVMDVLGLDLDTIALATLIIADAFIGINRGLAAFTECPG